MAGHDNSSQQNSKRPHCYHDYPTRSGRARQVEPAEVQTSKPGQTSTHVVTHPRGVPRAARGRASDAFAQKRGQNGSNGASKPNFSSNLSSRRAPFGQQLADTTAQGSRGFLSAL